MKKKKAIVKKYKKFNYIYLLMSLITLVLIYFLDVLPILYTILLTLGMFLIDFSFWFLTAVPKIKLKIKKVIFIISIIFIILFLFADIYIIKTMGFFNKISSGNSKVTNYSVYVLKDSKYSKLEDLKDKKMGFYKTSESANDKITVPVDFDGYTNLTEMIEDTLNSKIDSFILEDSLKELITDEEDNYFDKLKVINKFSITEESDTSAKAVNVTKDSFNIFLSGIDTYGNISSVSRSDVNMVATVNPNTNTILLTSIPRDYYVDLYNKTGKKDKLTHAGLYGIDSSIGTISNLLNVDINYYVKVNFTSLIDIVDALGGIEIESDFTFTAWDGTKFKKGTNKLNGEKALSFSRERHSFADGDVQRGKDQEIVLKAIIKKIMSPTIITKYDTLLAKLSSKVQTNMTQKDITKLVKKQISDNKDWNIETNNLEGTNGLEYTYSYSTHKLYVMIPNPGSISKAHDLILEVSGKHGV